MEIVIIVLLLASLFGVWLQTEDPTVALPKYKALLDAGVITAEEFEAKKKQLLGL